jgi:hypothetical protein
VKVGLCLPRRRHGDDGGEAADDEPLFGVDHDPLLLASTSAPSGFCEKGRATVVHSLAVMGPAASVMGMTQRIEGM